MSSKDALQTKSRQRMMTSIDDLSKIPFRKLSDSDQKDGLKKGALFRDKSNHTDRNDSIDISSSKSKKDDFNLKKKSPQKNFDLNKAFSSNRKNFCCSDQKQ